MNGILYIVATPIGNLGDITFRAIEILKQSEAIACEDTRHSHHLLLHYGIQKPTLRYDEHNHHVASERVLELLSQGKNVSLITDAGTPAISDPGVRLVRTVLDKGYKVFPIPGPSSLLAALSASGCDTNGFLFLGFLPRKKGPARRALQEGFGLGKTVALFESPFRVQKTLEIIEELDPTAQVTVARELTKIHEEFLRGQAERVKELVGQGSGKGEFVILIEPSPQVKNQNE